MNDMVKIRSFRSGLTLAGQLQQGALPRIGPWVLVGHDCAAILRQSLPPRLFRAAASMPSRRTSRNAMPIVRRSRKYRPIIERRCEATMKYAPLTSGYNGLG